MIQKIYTYESSSLDPYFNIAIEKHLLETVEKGSCILYLWQNKNTVVIGRNQNAWAECRTAMLECEGGKLARRLSGGGAVFHDTGNLNFTFLVAEDDYDVDKQLSVIVAACAAMGIRAEKSGRNDLLAGGQKFSGNAFYHHNGKAYHHGTLLVNADMKNLSRYLTPPKAKLEAKGVASVRSRVTNLQNLCPSLTCEGLKIALKEAFCSVYGHEAVPYVIQEKALDSIQEQAALLGSWQWLYGPKLPFSIQCEGKYPWGYISLQLQVEAGCIQTAQVYSDSMDWTLSETVSGALTGCRLQPEALKEALLHKMGDSTQCHDIYTLLETQL